MTTHNPYLSIGDAEEIASWFVKHMTMEQRRELIRERPLLYSRLFPDVNREIIAGIVTQALGVRGS